MTAAKRQDPGPAPGAYGFGFLAGKKDPETGEFPKTGKIYMIRCYKCGRENYTMFDFDGIGKWYGAELRLLYTGIPDHKLMLGTEVQINDRIVWEARLSFPCAGGITGFIPNGDCRDASGPAESDPFQFKADFDAPAGSVVYLHIQNHGDNSYNMVEASVEGRSFILSDTWTHVSKGLRVRPAGRPASTEGETGVP